MFMVSQWKRKSVMLVIVEKEKCPCGLYGKRRGLNVENSENEVSSYDSPGKRKVLKYYRYKFIQICVYQFYGNLLIHIIQIYLNISISYI